MFETRTTRRGQLVSKPQSLAGVTAAIPAGSEVVIASAQLYDSGFPVLESLYYNGDSAGTGDFVFRVTLDGVQLGDSWALPSYNAFGQAGVPRPIGKNLPNGRLLEIRCKNNGALTTLRAYSDGEVSYYDRPV